MTEKPRTHNADLAHLPAALVPLTEEQRWVVWPWELRVTKNGKEKWTKPPRQARDPKRNARSNDPSTWGTYTDAVAAVAAGNADGIGYMLKESNIGAIDLDHCVDTESTKLETWAEQLCSEANGAYQEITVSGAGLRIIGTVSGSETHRKFTFEARPVPGSSSTATRRATSRSAVPRSAGHAPSCRRSMPSSTRCSCATAGKQLVGSTSTTLIRRRRWTTTT